MSDFLKIKLSNCDDFFLIDKEDYEKVMIWRLKTTRGVKLRKWRRHAKGYVGTGKKIRFLHRVVLDIKKNAQLSVDHINGNILDNRKSNLRICTHAENTRNRGIRSDNKTGFKGVSLSESGRRFAARIKVNYKNIRLGYFEKKEDAARAYDKAAREFHGEFARLNFPDEAA